MPDEKEDKNGKDVKTVSGKKKRATLSLGDFSGRTVRKTATSEAEKVMEKKTEGHKSKTEGHRRKSEGHRRKSKKTSDKKEGKKVEAKPTDKPVKSKKEEDPLEALYKKHKIITVNFKGESIPLKSMEEDDFLAWIASIMPMTQQQLTGLYSQNFDDYSKRKRLLEKVVDYHIGPILIAAKEQDKEPFTVH